MISKYLVVIPCAFAFAFACSEPPTLTCEPGTPAACTGDLLTTCVTVDNGDSFVVTETCGAGTTCDAASGSCRVEQASFCGDGSVDAGEACDDGNNLNGDTCNADCARPSCGDGITGNTPNEECDDGNAINTDLCANDCTVNIPAGCGNNILESGEACDDGDNLNGDTCDANCSLPACGNGLIGEDAAGLPEQCDDGNNTNLDGCSSVCVLEGVVCGNGVQEGAEQCDDSNLVNGDGCNSVCVLECGDGTLNAVEACDDGNNLSGDGCDALCVIEVCGDSLVNNDGAEQCDDGNVISGDGCSAICLDECGDGAVNSVEECDDGNFVDGDGCEADCSLICGGGSGAFRASLDPSTGSCYLGFLQALTWPQAEASCEGRGGYLAVIDSAAENAIAHQNFPFGEIAWIGFNDREVEANSNAFGFVKVTGGNLTFNGFLAGEPNNNNGIEDCAHFLGNSPQFAWNDRSCDSAIPAFVCEIEPVPCGDAVFQAAIGEQCDDGNNLGGDGCDAVCLAEALTETEPSDDGIPHVNGGNGNDFANGLCEDGLTFCNVANAAQNCTGIGAGTCAAHNSAGLVVVDEVFDTAQVEVTAVAALSPAGDEDTFAVENNGANPVLITAETFGPNGAGTCNGVDTEINFRDAAGVELANDDNAGINNCSLRTFTINPGQTFFVHVIDFGDNTLVPLYLLRLRFQEIICGDGVLLGGEACEDGNVTSGDGCSSVCQVEAGFECVGAPSVCVGFFACGAGETLVSFTAPNVPVALPDDPTVLSVIPITDAGVITRAFVTLGNVSHSFDADLDIFLISPAATSVELSTDNGSSGDGYIGTVLSENCSRQIQTGAAPFTGCFNPEGNLNAFAGQSLTGNWTLSIDDDASGDTGTLNAWTLSFCVAP